MASKIAMGVNFLLGGVLTGVSLNIMEKTRKCTDVAFQRSLEGVLVVSVSILVAAIAYIICHSTCKCQGSESPMARTLFALYFIALGIVLIVLGAIIQAKAKKDCSEAKNGATTIWSVGIVIVVASMGYFILEHRENITAGIKAGVSGIASPKSGSYYFF